jgi:hypothetical protein
MPAGIGLGIQDSNPVCMPTSTYRQVTGAYVWTTPQTDKASLTVPLPADVIRSFKAALAKEPLKSKGYVECTPDDFRVDGLSEFGASISDIIMSIGGRGAAIISKVPVDDFSMPDIEKLYWGLGLNIGIPVSQSAFGDMLGYVQDLTWRPDGQPFPRGYTGRGELVLHNDSPDATVLMNIRSAKSGGISFVASAATVYNVLLAERPDVVEVLVRGFPYHWRGEQPDGDPEMTPWNVPFFAFKDGVFGCRYVPRSRVGIDRDFTSQEAEAYDVFDAIAARVAVCADLRPGEILLTNNFTALHARSEFEDWDEEERKRLLLRLWLQSLKKRPVHEHQRKPGWCGWPIISQYAGTQP